MATITYGGPGDETLTGGSGKDTFKVKTKALGPDTVWLSDPGGTNKLVLKTNGNGFDNGYFERLGDGAIAWNTEKGGQVIFGGPGTGDATLAKVTWKSGSDTLEKLRLTTDLTPEPAKDIGLIGSASGDEITLPGSGKGKVTGQAVVWADKGSDVVVSSPDQATLVFGGAGGDYIRTPANAAGTFFGGAGDDTLVGCGGKDALFGDGGADVIVGCKSRDSLYGGNGGGSLYGGTGKDRLWGGSSDDVLEGGEGRDRHWGDGGADVFAFTAALDEGKDLLMDFQDGSDLIRIAGAGFDDLIIESVAKGADTKITLPSGTIIRIENISDSQIGAEDFLFL